MSWGVHGFTSWWSLMEPQGFTSQSQPYPHHAKSPAKNRPVPVKPQILCFTSPRISPVVWGLTSTSRTSWRPNRDLKKYMPTETNEIYNSRMLEVKITIDQCGTVHCGQPPCVFFITYYVSSLLFNSSTSWLRSDISIWQKLTTINSRHVAKIFLKLYKNESFNHPRAAGQILSSPFNLFPTIKSSIPPKKIGETLRFLKTKELLEYVLQSIPAIHVATVHSRHSSRLKPRWKVEIFECLLDSIGWNNVMYHVYIYIYNQK